LHIQENIEILANSINFQGFLGLSDEIMIWAYKEGRYYYMQKEYEDAEAIFCFLTLCNTLVCDYWIGLGMTQRALQKNEEALHSFSIAALVNQDSFLARYYLTELYLQMGFISDAKIELSCFEEIIKKHKRQDLYPAYENLHLQLAGRSHGN
jgi:tetratricopeptide (TPR) repeat protein